MLPVTLNAKAKTSEREKTPGRENRSDGFTFSLAVYGSSAPIYSQPPKTYRPQKIPQVLKKESKRHVPFPVEKIIVLAERLELTSLREQKLESISYFNEENQLEKNECDGSATGLDFSLDLSSVNAESDDSYRETMDNLHYNSRSSTKREEGEDSEKSDLVNFYVNSVDNQELTKYFRPCDTCKETFCLCPKEAKGKSSKAVETELSISLFERESGSPPYAEKRYDSVCRSSCCCPDDFLEDRCPECMCECELGGLASTQRMLAYASSLASAARSARLLARDLESVLSSFKDDADCKSN